jgi:SsrA-binding protein
MPKATPDNIKIVAKNRKARHNFLIEETFEAGMVLLGTEVKSLRDGQCSLAEGYVRPQGDELFLIEVSITPYSHGTHENHEERRPRKLLMHRREIDMLIAGVSQGGKTIVPLMIYFTEGRAKVQIGLASRRRKWDKRDKKAQKQARRDVQRELSRR